MAVEDVEKTAFLTPCGVYCYTCMPFGLRNAGATFQRLMHIALGQQLGRNTEAYVDDIVVKPREARTLIPTVVASSTYIGPGPLPKYRAGREPTTAGKFEGGQLVQAILTKVVFACEKLWGDAVLGSTMTSVSPSS